MVKWLWLHPFPPKKTQFIAVPLSSSQPQIPAFQEFKLSPS